MRKLITLNTILAFSGLSVFILGYYLIRFPDDFDIVRYIRYAEWTAYGFVVVGLLFASAILGFLPFKSCDQRTRAAIVLAALQGLFLLLFFIKMAYTYQQNKRELDRLMTEFRRKADADIKSGFINLEYAGGLEFPDSRELMIRTEIDSIRRLYGFSYSNSGCIVSSDLILAQAEYEKRTKPFLDKRNGRGWEKKMELAIESGRNTQ